MKSMVWTGVSVYDVIVWTGVPVPFYAAVSMNMVRILRAKLQFIGCLLTFIRSNLYL